MAAQKFRKKPVEIEAIQFNDWDDAQDILDFIGTGTRVRRTMNELVIETLEGDMKARKGWWIIKGIKGEFYPCDPDIFAGSYDKVEEPA